MKRSAFMPLAAEVLTPPDLLQSRVPAVPLRLCVPAYCVGALPGGVEPNYHYGDAVVAARDGLHAGATSGSARSYR